MKKFLFVAVVLLAVATASAQNRKLSFGIKGALNLSSASIDKDLLGDGSKKTFVGYSYGLFVEVPLGRSVSIQPEILISSRGFGYRGNMLLNEQSVDVKGELYNKYIDIPILFKVYLTKSLSLDFGPQLGIAIRNYISVKRMDLNAIEEDYQMGKVMAVQGKKLYNKVDFALCLGLTYNVRKVFFNARYNLGLVNAFKQQNVMDIGGIDLSTLNATSFKSKLHGFQLGMGYRF